MGGLLWSFLLLCGPLFGLYSLLVKALSLVFFAPLWSSLRFIAILSPRTAFLLLNYHFSYVYADITF